ncbi:hypothetical protein QEZ54_20480 [Catellatospora sp. KI3]|uniref:hypothetical protein n=1 Tax=Catellatospora sp. KI3 TaxID=3041620 RepID=UPI0024822A7B|nr:hypothetical protein [Catellatospora sp. KI3]MDI1463363.1 hypothetical protein [Catellatospora sp. KI3]
MTIFDWCRHCGVHKPMTEEHLPPRAAGNASPITVYTERDGMLAVLRSYQDGHTIPSLCLACNNGAGDRGLPQAYALWRDDTIGHLQRAAAGFHHVTGQPHNDMFWVFKDTGAFTLPMEHGRGLGTEHLVTLNPSRIIRQVLGMIMAVQDSRHLLDVYPQLVSAYRSDKPASIEPLTVHVALANVDLGYFRNGVLSVSVDLTGQATSSSTQFWAVAFPPFLIFLANGSKPPIEATRIDQWLAYPAGNAFSKRDRKIVYPIADPRELLVRKLYQDQAALNSSVGRHMYPLPDTQESVTG